MVFLPHSFFKMEWRLKFFEKTTISANCKIRHRSDLESVSFAAISNPTPLISSLCFHRLCQACRRPFNDPAVARYPNGVTTHLHCARNKNVCPVTGHVFSFVDHTTESPKDE